ncbi:mechanosensitive ion channel [Inquilinus limosus]|uniref:mechanosensitive ion channel family protein n=1 Tax=Inquilinus limosus TaxID=171674 RepID=UPI003F18F6A1
MINFDSLWALFVFYGLNVLYAVVLLGLGWWLARSVERWLLRLAARTRHVDPTIADFLASLARYLVLAVVVIAVLQIFGIQTTSLVAVLGAASLAIGLALQGTLSNLAAGVMLLIFRPFKIGDAVEVAGKVGTVRSLSLFMTELVTPANVQILLPNGSVWGAAIVNTSTYPGPAKMDLAFLAPAGPAGEELAREIVAALKADPRLVPGAEPSVVVSKLVDLSKPGAGVVELTVSAPVATADVGAVKSALMERINTSMGRLIPSGLASGGSAP